MRRSALFLALAGVPALVLMVAIASSPSGLAPVPGRIERSRELARALRVTDLCIFTEAPYTRHPALVDRAQPFQDSPFLPDHFPSGSLIQPSPFPAR